MLKTTLSTKGQFVLPKDVRERHGWHAGTRLEVVDLGDAVLLRTPKPFPETNLQDGLGLLAGPQIARTPAEMQAAVDDLFRETWTR